MPVVVAGAGACGLTASLAARDAGAEVLVLEADAQPAGSTAMSLGALCAAATREHRRHGIEDSPDRFFADIMAKTDGRADALLARTIAEESGPVVDWLHERHALPLELDFAWTGLGHAVPRLHQPPGRTGTELVTRLADAATRAGAEVLMQARVVALFADEHSRVRGVRIARPDGSTEDLGCDALVLATCGFGGNHSMIADHIPEMQNARYFGHESNKGEGILLGHALGGDLADMTAYQGLGTLAEPHAVIVPHPLLIEGGVLVNALGARFTHELANISGMCVPVLAQPGAVAWVIFDQARHLNAVTHSFEQRQLDESGAIRRADSPEELERACGLPSGSLQREFAEANAARDTGTADRFGRSFANLAPLAPPYCAIKVTGALFHTQGGLVVDHDAQVRRRSGERLPNLFAGGGAARSISGPEVTGYLPGAGLCMAVTLGRLAGRAAARVALSTIAASPA